MNPMRGLRFVLSRGPELVAVVLLAAGCESSPTVASEWPVPIINGTDPSLIVATSVLTPVRVLGEGFVWTTELFVNGVSREFELVSGTELRFALSEEETQPGVVHSLVLVNPPPGGGTTEPFVIGVGPSEASEPPMVLRFDPPWVTEGSAGITLQIRGRDFEPGSTVLWSGSERATTYVGPDWLRVQISAGDLASAGAGRVVVRNTDARGDSQVAGFPIMPAEPTAGASLTVNLVNSDIVADPVRDVVYAAAPSDAPSMFQNRVFALDTRTADVIWSLSVGSDPRRLVVSEDGAYLYVGLHGAPLIVRIDLESRVRDLDISLGQGFFQTLRMEDLVVLPGASTSVAASLRNLCCSPRHEGVFIYDGASRRAGSTQGHTGSNRIEGSRWATRLYGLNNETTEFGFRRISVTGGGPREDGGIGGVTRGFDADIFEDEGLVFTTDGQVLDAERLMILGTIPSSSVMTPDVANGRVLIYSGTTLEAIHYSDFSSLGSVEIPQASDLSVMIRYGSDGVALGGGDSIVFTRSTLVGPP